MARCLCRRGTTTTVCNPITFAMIQMVNDWAWKANRRFLGMKSLWRGPCFKNISPRTAGAKQGAAPLDGEKAGLGYLEDMRRVNANWYLVTGHHAVMYKDVPEGNRNVGFFNHYYHEGRWIHGSPGNPEYGSRDSRGQLKWRWKYELYMKTSPETVPPDLAPFEQMNPLMTADMYGQRRKTCKGLILGGCNTLGYSRARMAWSGFYPDSLILGTYTRTNAAVFLTTALCRTRMTRKIDFWRDPSRFLTNDEKLITLVKDLAAGFPHGRYSDDEGGIAVVYKGKAFASFVKTRGSKPEVDPIPLR